MERKSYTINSITINGNVYSKVIIDPHFKEKHSEYINDDLILALVNRLNGRRELPVDFKNEFQYYVTVIDLNKKNYRLIWLLETNTIYIGVVNAFRDSKGE